MTQPLFQIEMQGDVAIMCLMLDAFTHDDNEALMKPFEQLLKEGTRKIILDMANTKYVSSLILASLVYMQKRAQDGGGALVFCAVKDRVAEIMRLTNLDKVFTIVPTRVEAIERIK